jgi:hypothetical protein
MTIGPSLCVNLSSCVLAHTIERGQHNSSGFPIVGIIIKDGRRLTHFWVCSKVWRWRGAVSVRSES